MADQRTKAERWISFAAGIVTPVTLITALLFYFGYVSAPRRSTNTSGSTSTQSGSAHRTM